MSAESNDQDHHGWLEKLQRESWQMELVISAFSIFLLIGLEKPLDDLLIHVQNNYGEKARALLLLLGFFLRGASTLFLIHLVAHLFLRGFWIGVLGLRSIVPSVEVDQLRYTERFARFIDGKVDDLNALAQRLDNLSSAVFGVTFTVVLMLMAPVLYVLFLILMVSPINSLINGLDNWIGTVLTTVVVTAVVVYLLTGLLYFIDFITMGWLKRVRWLSRVYYPFYRFFGYITLAFLYRPLYYSLISKYKKWRIFWLTAFYLLFIWGPISFEYTVFFSDQDLGQVMTAAKYDNLRKPGTHIADAAVSSDILEGPLLRLFITYRPEDNNGISEGCPDLELPYEPGMQGPFSGVEVTSEGGSFLIGDRDPDADMEGLLLDCLSGYYKVYVNDVLLDDLTYDFYQHPNKGEKGIITYVPAEYFQSGRNMIRIATLNHGDEDVTEANRTFIQVRKP